MKQLNDAHQLYMKKKRRHNFLIHFIRLLILTVFIAGWEILSSREIISSFIFSSPGRIINCLVELSKNGFLFKHIRITVFETLICFTIVMLSALVLSIIMWLNRNIFEVIEPYLILLNSIPKSALAPLLIVWLGNNTKTIIIAAASVAVFGAVLSMYTAFIETDPEKIRLIKTLGGKKKHILTLLVLPSSLPSIVNIMKVNLGLSLVGVIIGEFLAAKEGLGYMIIYGSQVFKMDWVILSILLLLILSGFLYVVIRFFERKTMK